jgi:hypothetical protein
LSLAAAVPASSSTVASVSNFLVLALMLVLVPIGNGGQYLVMNAMMARLEDAISCHECESEKRARCSDRDAELLLLLLVILFSSLCSSKGNIERYVREGGREGVSE